MAGSAAGDWLRGRAPQPSETLAGRYPRFAMKRALRWAFDRFQSDRMTEWALRSEVAKSVIGRLYFHKRSAASEVQPAPRLGSAKAPAGPDSAE